MIRKTNLDDTVALYKFNNEVADELDYFAEKSAILANNNFGSSVSEVQSLQRKHEVRWSLFNRCAAIIAVQSVDVDTDRALKSWLCDDDDDSSHDINKDCCTSIKSCLVILDFTMNDLNLRLKPTFSFFRNCLKR